jgi:hypothetical protein
MYPAFIVLNTAPAVEYFLKNTVMPRHDVQEVLLHSVDCIVNILHDWPNRAERSMLLFKQLSSKYILHDEVPYRTLYETHLLILFIAMEREILLHRLLDDGKFYYCFDKLVLYNVGLLLS